MRTLLFSFLILFYFQSNAEDTIQFSQGLNYEWTIQSDTIISLKVLSRYEHTYQLKVRGESGAIVWKKRFSASSFTQRMSLGLLPENKYTFELYVDGVLFQSKPLFLNVLESLNAEITMPEVSLPQAVVEIVEEEQGSVRVEFKNPLIHTMCIVVRGKSGAAIFKTFVRNKESYKALFSLQHLTPGVYTVELLDGSLKVEELRVIID